MFASKCCKERNYF